MNLYHYKQPCQSYIINFSNWGQVRPLHMENIIQYQKQRCWNLTSRHLRKKHSSKIFTAQTLKRHMQALIRVTHSPTDEYGRHITASYICLLHAQKQHSDRKTSQIIWNPLGNSVHHLSMQRIEFSIEEKKPSGQSWKINITCSSLLKDTAGCGKPTKIACLAADYWGWKQKVIKLIQIS